MFGPWKLDRREVFLETKLCLAIVNYKPIVPGEHRSAHNANRAAHHLASMGVHAEGCAIL